MNKFFITTLLILGLHTVCHADNSFNTVTIHRDQYAKLVEWWRGNPSWQQVENIVSRLQSGEMVEVNGITLSEVSADVVIPKEMIDRIEFTDTETGLYVNHYVRADLVKEFIDGVINFIDPKEFHSSIQIKTIGTLEINIVE